MPNYISTLTKPTIIIMLEINLYSIILAALTAIASGMVGSFALMRRMTLAGDAFSHIALPGIGLAMLFSWNPVLGGAIVLFIGVLVIWKAEKLSQLNTEAVIGVLFTISLALGALAFEEEHELIEALFGSIVAITSLEFYLGSIGALLIVWFVIANRHALVLMLVSKEIAKTAGIAIDRLQLLFLLIFALTVILGMKFLGVLLMGSLIIIPAATARSLARNLDSMLIIASLVSLLSVISGLLLAQALDLPLGPVIIIVASAIFILALGIKFIGQNR